MADVVFLEPGYYPNPDTNRAIGSADIYVGIVDLDPEILANQKQLSVRQEDNTIVNVSQPIHTSAGGVPQYDGSPVTLLVDGPYSLKVLSSTGVQIYYVPESETSAKSLIDADHNADGSHIVYESIAELRASTLTPFDGQVVKVTGYYAGTENRKWFFRWYASSTSTDNTGSIIKKTDTTTGRWFYLRDGTPIDVDLYGAKADGTDDEPEINACLAVENNVYFPPKTYSVNVENRGGLDYGIQPRSDTILRFAPGATLQAITNSVDTYRVLLILLVDNVTVHGGIFSGDKDTHTGVTGEAGHALAIYNSTNIKVHNAQGNNGWGVGLALAANENVYIENCTFDNNRQNGGALISGRHITLVNPKFTNNEGTSPAGGFDIEPNNNTDYLEDIHIINPYTSGNAGVGILIALNQLKDGDASVSITIDNPVDNGSNGGLYIEKLEEGTTGTLNGSITINNLKSTDAYFSGLQIANYAALKTPNVTINKPTVINCNAGATGLSQYASGIIFYREPSVSNTNLMGNVTIINPTIQDTRAVATMPFGMYLADGKAGGFGFSNFKILNPLEISGLAIDEINYYAASSDNVTLVDDFNIISGEFASTKTLTTRLYTKLMNSGGVLVNFNVNTGITDNPITFTDDTGFGIRLTPAIGESILPISAVAGKYITTTGKGGSVTLRKISSTEYYIENLVGTWTVEP